MPQQFQTTWKMIKTSSTTRKSSMLSQSLHNQSITMLKTLSTKIQVSQQLIKVAVSLERSHSMRFSQPIRSQSTRAASISRRPMLTSMELNTLRQMLDLSEDLFSSRTLRRSMTKPQTSQEVRSRRCMFRRRLTTQTKERACWMRWDWRSMMETWWEIQCMERIFMEAVNSEF